jgi:hypothetical protein
VPVDARADQAKHAKYDPLVLIRMDILRRIAAGEVDTAFRRQRRPTVKAGGNLRTPVGMLAIDAVERIEPDDVTDADARRSGATGRDEVIAFLLAKPDGDCYRVRLRLLGEDPRIVLREDDALDEAAVAGLMLRLNRLDAASPNGPWTRAILRLIAERPHVRAPDLAASMGRETQPFKADVRKLKALALTISHSPGYELSPRGRALLRRL